MQLTDLPPEIICVIYEFLIIKDKVKLSLVNSYIYDCRPIDKINHRKRMNMIGKRINSMKYNIVDRRNGRYVTCTSSRAVNNVISMYRHHENNNVLFIMTTKENDGVFFKYTTFPVYKKTRRIRVDTIKQNGIIHTLIR
jgi:hypothetical protein